MVHGQLIQEGKVQKLTYSQLRRLEKIDAKKAREQKLYELADSAIKAGGQTLEGAFAGLGLGLQGYLSGDLASFIAKSAAGVIVLDWIRREYPKFSALTHLDTLEFGTRGPPPPTSTGKFCIRNRGAATRALVARGFGSGQELCYNTEQEREQAINAFRDLDQRVDIEQFMPG